MKPQTYMKRFYFACYFSQKEKKPDKMNRECHTESFSRRCCLHTAGTLVQSCLFHCFTTHINRTAGICHCATVLTVQKLPSKISNATIWEGESLYIFSTSPLNIDLLQFKFQRQRYTFGAQIKTYSDGSWELHGRLSAYKMLFIVIIYNSTIKCSSLPHQWNINKIYHLTKLTKDIYLLD